MRIRTFSNLMLAALVLSVAAVTGLAHAETGAAAQPATQPGPKSDAKYAVAIASTSDNGWDAIRYDAHAGKSWKLKEGAWELLKDSTELPASDYEVQLVALKGDWGALRIDLHSGRSWRATPEGWVEITEAAAAVSQSPEPAEAK